MDIFITKECIMKRTIKLTERDFTRLIKRIVREQDEIDIEQTVMDAGEFDSEEIPAECKGDNPGMSKIEMLNGCIGSITKKSTSLTSALTALTSLLTKAETQSASSTVAESRRRRYRNY
jgi:hypothetical protein